MACGCGRRKNNTTNAVNTTKRAPLYSVYAGGAEKYRTRDITEAERKKRQYERQGHKNVEIRTKA